MNIGPSRFFLGRSPLHSSAILESVGLLILGWLDNRTLSFLLGEFTVGPGGHIVWCRTSLSWLFGLPSVLWTVDFVWTRAAPLAGCECI